MSKRWTFWMGRNDDESSPQSGEWDGRGAEPLGLNHGQNVGENIKRLRVKAGMTQQDLGDALGISAQAVSKWENGLAAPDISLLVPVAAVFHVTLDTLFGVDLPTPSQPDTKSELDSGMSAGPLDDVPIEPAAGRVEAERRDEAPDGQPAPNIGPEANKQDETEPNRLGEAMNEVFAPHQWKDFGKQIEASVHAIVNAEEIQAQVRQALSSVDKDALRRSIQATIRASVDEAKRGIEKARRELKNGVTIRHAPRRDGDNAHEHGDRHYCVVCDSFFGEDERHCTGCHQNYGEDVRHCTGCHQNYGEDERHCTGCHQNFGEDDQHCPGCHENYGEDDQHCQGCHGTYGEDDQHCQGCHETYGEDDQHCAGCHETYGEDEQHCPECHETYSEGERHLCA